MSIGDDLKYQWRHGGMVKRLLFVNIGVFLTIHLVGFICWAFHLYRWDHTLQYYLMSSGNVSWLLHKPWTVITHMFTHYDPGHIIGNMLIFWFAGQLFQGTLGPRRLLGNYLLGGLTGFAFYLLGGLLPAHLAMSSRFPILGASAAVMSILIGIATYHPNLELRFFFVSVIKLKYMAIGLFVLDLIAIKEGSNTGGHVAHLGGALYGFLAARQMQKNGTDWSGSFINGLERIWNFLRGKRRTRLRVEKRATRKVRVTLDADFNAAKREKQERVDAILDKISRSGYDSLSKDERDFLFRASHEQ